MSYLESYIVTSGSYYVGRKKPLLLRAGLGTCVGVALYDRDADVGGLHHLLLPEPISSENILMPEKYASSGLPLFIQELFALGASRDNLKACISGGALVGPLMNQDLDLDIGGRTTEVVKNILAEEGIQIEKAETGGLLSSDLCLDMQTWEPSTKPLEHENLSGNQHVKVPTAEEINSGIEQLQPIPQVALKILRMIEDDNYDVKEISEEIRKDQVISARTLKLCNSPMFARNKIDTLDHAVVFLGQKIFFKLILSAALQGLFSLNTMGYSLCKGALYHHAVGTALIAEELASFTGKVSPSLAYTAGLLHDIGKVVLDQYIASAFTLFYRHLEDLGRNLLEVENIVFGIDHTVIGSELAKKWVFPEVLIDTILNHHNPDEKDANSKLTTIVYLADLLMTSFYSGLELERLDTRDLASRLENVGLSVSLFSKMIDLIPYKVFASPE